MNILAWIIFGALAGWIASIIMKKNKQMGAIANIVVGIIGAFLGGAIMNFLGYEGITGFDLWSFLVAVIGAVVLLFIVGLIRR
ncbi:MAG: GlsB/YeaQ/YmgE family stress response membrane protein [Anaerolineales bacterium]|nr:GlsB/YeaQ/YmgE family stress response membrane protein [Anaerolineales bacterium]